MDWVSFDEIKKVVTLQMAIEHYGIQLRHVNANDAPGQMPLADRMVRRRAKRVSPPPFRKAWAVPGHASRNRASKHEDASAETFSISSPRWNNVPSVMRRSNCKCGFSFPRPATDRDRLARNLTRKVPRARNRSASWFQKKKLNGGGESESNKPLTFNLQNIDHHHPYLKERGVTEEIAQKFGVGFFPGKGSMHDRIVIPIHNPKGELVAYAGRSIDGSEPRYKFPAGFHKSMELYNVHRVRDEVSVVLVEGFFDCMKVTQAGFPVCRAHGFHDEQRARGTHPGTFRACRRDARW